MKTGGSLIMLLLYVFVISSCGRQKKNNYEVNSDSIQLSSTTLCLDSIEKEKLIEEQGRARLAAIASLPSNRRYGTFNMGDTIYFGDLLIKIDSITKTAEKKDQSRYRSLRSVLPQNYTYDFYMSVLNTSDSITMELPYIFIEKNSSEMQMHINSGAESVYYLGMRMFIEKGKNLSQAYRSSNFIIDPKKERTGRYHVVGRDSDSFYFSFGDPDEEAETTVPDYYYYEEGMKSRVNFTVKLIDKDVSVK